MSFDLRQLEVSEQESPFRIVPLISLPFASRSVRCSLARPFGRGSGTAAAEWPELEDRLLSSKGDPSAISMSNLPLLL